MFIVPNDKVSYAGVCHSDIHFWEGGYVLENGNTLRFQDRPGFKYPCIPGKLDRSPITHTLAAFLARHTKVLGPYARLETDAIHNRLERNNYVLNPHPTNLV